MLNGLITARGFAQSTGGGIGIVIMGGAVTGSGTLDASVESGSTTNTHYRSGGGRISVTGYSAMSASIIANARMDGSRWYGSGAGTFYYRSQSPSDFGSLMVRCVGYTPDISSSESRTAVISLPNGRRLSRVRVINARLLLEGTGSIHIDELEISSGGWLKINGQNAQVNSDFAAANYLRMVGGTLTVNGSVTVPSGGYLVMSGGSLSINSNVIVSGGGNLISNSAIRVVGNLTMIGNIDHNGGSGAALDVGGFVSWRPLSGEALPDTMSAGSLLVHTSGSLTVPNTMRVSGLLQVASSLTVNGGATVHDLDVLNGGTLVLNSVMMVNRSAIIRSGGTVTHAATSSAAATVQFRVLGAMTVESGGQINVDQRSSYTRPSPAWPSNGAAYPSHGGRGLDGYSGWSNDVYVFCLFCVVYPPVGVCAQNALCAFVLSALR